MSERPTLWVGLMSGTSADAVDAALVRIGPRASDVELVAYVETPIDAELRKRIHDVVQAPVALRELVALDQEIGNRFAGAALEVMRRGGASPGDVEGIGSHGQTVGHFPEPGVRGTLQIGAPSVIHERTGVPVVADFRSADLAAGGQGAPLTPFLHHTLFARSDEVRAVLNIGGFTNVTFLPGVDPDAVVAFDPGPGNALLDRAVRHATGGAESYDRDGRRALQGRVSEALLGALLADPYFDTPPPKSTGHEHFGAAFFEDARARNEADGGSPEDLLATLAALTVASVVDAARRFFPDTPERWIVYGGGVHNAALMQSLAERLSPAPLEQSDEHGLPADAVEAVTFALLGYCSARGIASNLPRATGANRALPLGAATPPDVFRRLKSRA